MRTVVDEPGDQQRWADDDAFRRACTDAGRPGTVAVVMPSVGNGIDVDPAPSGPVKVGRTVVATVTVFLLVLVLIQVRAGVSADELLAEPSHLLDLSVANHRWQGDRPDHAGSFVFLRRDASGPVRWPCGFVIRWAYNPAGVADDAYADLNEAIARISEASGARFRYVGTTDIVPSSASSTVPGADLVVAWLTPGATDALGTDGRRHALATTLTTTQGSVITGGAIVVNLAKDGDHPGGFGRGETRGRILLHELGHVLGLGHVDDSTQVMAPYTSDRYPTAFGAGDLTGLGIAGCR
jgi:hypothetical protein